MAQDAGRNPFVARFVAPFAPFLQIQIIFDRPSGARPVNNGSRGFLGPLRGPHPPSFLYKKAVLASYQAFLQDLFYSLSKLACPGYLFEKMCLVYNIKSKITNHQKNLKKHFQKLIKDIVNEKILDLSVFTMRQRKGVSYYGLVRFPLSPRTPSLQKIVLLNTKKIQYKWDPIKINTCILDNYLKSSFLGMPFCAISPQRKM